jgi:hypothetical protein
MISPVKIKKAVSFNIFGQTPGRQYEVPDEYKDKFFSDDLDLFRRTFAYYDKDGNGSIDKEELATVMWEFEQDNSEARLAAIFEEADADNNQEIDFGEFLSIMYKSRSVGADGDFAQLASKVGKKVVRIQPGDLCYVPPHISGQLAYGFNILGLLVCVLWMVAVRFKPSTSYASSIIVTLKWLKVHNVKTVFYLQ